MISLLVLGGLALITTITAANYTLAEGNLQE